MTEVLRSATGTEVIGVWGVWFGDFATAAAAKRYLTMQWTGPKVADRDCWVGSEVKMFGDQWKVRLATRAILT